RLHHPSADRIRKLWEIYMDSIDPLTKIIHVSTIRPAIEKAAADTGAIPRSFEALMFAIYSAAIMSLNEAECQQCFSSPRTPLLTHHIRLTEAALSRAHFMSTTS